jgi:hypothetical protein
MYVKNNPDSIQALCEFLLQPDLKQKLKMAQERPSHPSSIRLVSFLQKHLQRSEMRIPFSAAERKLHLSELTAYCRHFGVPSAFITISPSDADQHLTIRLASKNNGSIKDLNLKQRSQIVNGNPVVCAEIFQKTMNNVMKHLIGLPTNAETKKDHASIEMRLKGILGTPVAYYGVYETQGRGSLHIHFLLWTRINYETMQNCASRKNSALLVEKAIDSVSCGSIPIEFQEQNLNRIEQRIPATRYAFETFSSTDFNSNTFQNRVFEIAAAYQTHSHSKTCYKGKVGKTRCRLSRPQETSENTHPVMIQRTESGSITFNLEIPQWTQTILQHEPFPDPDPRNIFWKLKRTPLDHPKLNNGNVVEFNPALTSALACNTCVSLLGDNCQAKSATYYMLKYMTKDPTALASSITCVYEAIKKSYIPSSADDRDTDSRRAKLLLQRILNRHIAYSEFSQTLCGYVLLGYASTIKSHNITWCFATAAVKEMEEFYNLEDPNLSDEEFEDDDTSEQDDSSEEDASSHVEVDVRNEPFSSENSKTNDCVPIQIVETDGEYVPSFQISQRTKYVNRGKHFANMSLYEYSALVKERMKKEPEPESVQPKVK